MNRQELIQELLKDPNKLKMKRPFTRGIERASGDNIREKTVSVSGTIPASLPSFEKIVVSQEDFMRELDPHCHNVLFDDNVPSICVKVKDGSYVDIKYIKMALSIQKQIKNEKVIYLTKNKMKFSLVNEEVSDIERKYFTIFKQYWDARNQDGMRNKAVDAQLSFGDAGVLYYFDYQGHVKSRLLSYEDGYVLCPHNDQNGDRILESVYYMQDNVEYIDSYDDKYLYRYVNKTQEGGVEGETTWVMEEPVPHGFQEIPLATKRGDVAWNDVQNDIECYEELYNIFVTIQKKHGWGVFYIKGRFADDGRRIAGNVVLNDTSMDGNGDAKFLTPPTPDGMMDTLKFMLRTIQMNASSTFILPDDVHLSGEISGLAVQLTKELDIQDAAQRVITWQNFADKMQRLFKFGLAKELVNSGKEEFKNAITDMSKVNISAKFSEWRPFNETEYNNMILSLVGGGCLSRKSGTELNTLSKADEWSRLQKEEEEKEKKMERQLAARGQGGSEGNQPNNSNNNNNTNSNDGGKGTPNKKE